MQPTVDTELAGVRRSLAALAASAGLPPDVIAELASVARTLERVERSWNRILPYLVSDNLAAARALQDMAMLVHPELRSRIDETVSAQPPPPDPRTLDVATANATNEDLRKLLSEALSSNSGGVDENSKAVRTRLIAFMRESLDDRPW